MTTLRRDAPSPRGLRAIASRPTRRRARLLPIGGLLLTLALAACGGQDSNGDDGAAASSSGGGGTTTTQNEQILDFYQCLRSDYGLDVDDPEREGQIQLDGLDADNPDHAAAVDDCAGRHLDMGDAGDEDMADVDALTDFTTCMQDEGIDMPDPSPDGGLSIGDVDPNAPEFQAAVDVCQEHLAGGGVRMTP